MALKPPAQIVPGQTPANSGTAKVNPLGGRYLTPGAPGQAAPMPMGGAGGPAPGGSELGVPPSPDESQSPALAGLMEAAQPPDPGFIGSGSGMLNPRLGTRTSPALRGFRAASFRY
jgi:hypothetical protein